MIARTVVTLVLVGAAFTRLAAQQPAPGAPLDLAGFKYSRTVPPSSGLTTAVLDAAALAHGRIDDIRIVESLLGSSEKKPTLSELRVRNAVRNRFPKAHDIKRC